MRHPWPDTASLYGVRRSRLGPLLGSVATVGAVALSVVSAALAEPAAGRAPVKLVKANVPARVTARESATISGRYRARQDLRVSVERRLGVRWRVEAAGRLPRSAKRFSVRWKAPAESGTYVIRVTLRRGRRIEARSRSYRLVVLSRSTNPRPQHPFHRPRPGLPSHTVHARAGSQPCASPSTTGPRTVRQRRRPATGRASSRRSRHGRNHTGYRLLEGLASAADGSLYIAKAICQVDKLSESGVQTVIAGEPCTDAFYGDGGPALNAGFAEARDVARGPDGSLYIADASDNRIRKIDAAGIITTVAGRGVTGFTGDGGPATAARLNYPGSVAVAADGTLYIADSWNHRIRKVDPSGVIRTIAGSGGAGWGDGGFSGDGGPATAAQLDDPFAVALDPDGSLYIADTSANRIRKIDAAGTITTVAGNGSAPEGREDVAGDGGPATAAPINPYNIQSLRTAASTSLTCSTTECARSTRMATSPQWPEAEAPDCMAKGPPVTAALQPQLSSTSRMLSRSAQMEASSSPMHLSAATTTTTAYARSGRDPKRHGLPLRP